MSANLDWAEVCKFCSTSSRNIVVWELSSEEIINKKLSSRQVEALTQNQKKPFSLVKQVDSNILNIKKQIEDSLGLTVNIINKKNNSGKVIVEYKNLEQFELVSNLLKKNES